MEDNVSTVELAGFSVNMSTDTEVELQRVRTFSNESSLVDAVMEELQPSDIFYDVGANIGMYTLFAAKIIDTGEIHSFEPHPENIKKLLKNMEREIDDIHCRVHEVALYNKDEVSRFDPVSREPAEGHGHVTPNGDLKIHCVRADQLDISPPNVVKIDVEGAEYRVLLGMLGILSECRAIFIETHPTRMRERYEDTISDIMQFAKRGGFKVKRIDRRGKEDFLKLEK